MKGLFTKWHLYGSYDFDRFYSDRNYLPNNRQIFSIEVVFDIDTPKLKDNHRLRDLISDNLQKEKKSHSIWRNGSESGNHIHCFFPELLDGAESLCIQYQVLLLIGFCCLTFF